MTPADLVLGVYFFCSAVLLIYGANAYFMLGSCASGLRRLRKENDQRYQRGIAMLEETDWPAVTTQIPLYNELAVAQRIIDAVAKLDYPAGLHRIQVLDDSTDDTALVVDKAVEHWKSRGVEIGVIRRAERKGFKAGALAEGLRLTNDPLIAIFDADFLPAKNFLRLAVPHLLVDSKAAWVQARWGHLNENETLLTRAQGVGIDGHFGIDQCVRAGENAHFMNFNGTCGVWQRAAIQDAGGWTADTLTEDLDLSYRAQLRGWHGLYLPDLVVPGELPADVNAFKSQQFRWAKGSIQTAMKLMPVIVRAPLPLLTKVEAWFHLTHYAIHPVIVLFALTNIVLALTHSFPHGPWSMLFLPVLVLSLAPTAFYAGGQCVLHKNWPERFMRLPALILAGIGLCLSNTAAVFSALTGKNTPFLRTPKQGNRRERQYDARPPISPFSELWGCLVCLGVFVFAASTGQAVESQFLVFLGAGFGFVALAPLHSGCQRTGSRLVIAPTAESQAG